jgi:hypothetical protein
MADAASKPDLLPKWLRIPAALLIGSFLSVGAYYGFSYLRNTDYLTSRNLRLLATLGGQVRDALRNEAKVFANVTRNAESGADLAETLTPPIRMPAETCPDLKDLPGAEDTGESGVKLWRTLRSHDGTYRLVLRAQDDAKPASRNQEGQNPSLRGQKAENPHCGEVELAGLLDPLFSSRQAFDAVMLADGEGKVVYLHGPKDLQVARLDLLVKSRHSGRDARAAEKNPPFGEYRGYSKSAEVELGGRIYTLFVQPFSLSLPSEIPSSPAKPNEKAPEGPRDVWLLAGLVANDAMTAKNLALSPSLVSLLLGILLLAALAWPLAKLRMLGERQRVRKVDVLLVGLCSLLGVSVATMALLDVGAYRILKNASDAQLHDFAEQMESNLLVEIRLAYDQLTSLEGQAGRSPSPTADTLPADFLTTALYPHFESFSLIDAEGEQQLKQSPPGSSPQRISVADRRYFQQILQRQTLTVPEPEKERRPEEPFFLESIQSWTNGKWQGGMAKPIVPVIHRKDPSPGGKPAADWVAAALAIQMLSVVNPIVPPDFEFAVVGDDGTVLFHSDPARNFSENFFAETDQDRRFRALLMARHDEPLDLRYWGESYRAFAIPVQGLPWTVVAMRRASILERMNLDWLVTTLTFILFYMSAITLALIAAALVRPKDLVAWIWPDDQRPRVYVQLLALMGLFCAAFLVALFALRGTGYLCAVATLLPALSLLVAYRMLSPAAGRPANRAAVLACGALLLLLLAVALFLARPENLVPGGVGGLTFALAAVACVLADKGPRRWRELAGEEPFPVTRSYPLLGFLVLLVVAVLPTVGFFKVAHRLQVDTFVRNGQLRMAQLLSKQLASADKKPSSGSALNHSLTILRDPAKSQPSLDFYGRAFFGTEIHPPRPHFDKCKEEKEKETDLLAAFLLPPYSDYTAESRELSRGSQTSDGDWAWCEAFGKVFFTSDHYLHVSLVSKNDPAWQGNGPFLAMAGLLPLREPIDLAEQTDRDPILEPEPPSETEGLGLVVLRQAPHAIATLFVLALFGTLLYALATFVARRVFLLGVEKPLWVESTGDLQDLVGANVFVISRDQNWQIRDREKFFSVSFRKLDNAASDWPERRAKLIRDERRTVLVDDFEYRAFDPVWTSRKLDLLEELVFVHQRAVVVLSELSPAVVFSPLAKSSEDKERWRTLLGSFIQIHKDVWPSYTAAESASTSRSWVFFDKLRNRFRHGAPTPPPTPPGEAVRPVPLRSPLREECGDDEFLKRIGGELQRSARSYGSEVLLEELGERAKAYYSALWSTCSSDERVVLNHLAEEGLVNAKNRQTVRRLLARGLVRREPNLRLMNETFRRFVVSPACEEKVLDLEQKAGPSAWDRFHWPFSVALAAAAALILITQQELLDSTLAVITGVTAGLPSLLKLIDALGWKRGTKAA